MCLHQIARRLHSHFNCLFMNDYKTSKQINILCQSNLNNSSMLLLLQLIKEQGVALLNYNFTDSIEILKACCGHLRFVYLTQTFVQKILYLASSDYCTNLNCIIHLL